MKTIKSKEGVIARVSDIDAAKKIMTGTWRYVPKKEWKDIRDANITQTVEVKEETKTKKATRRSKFKVDA